MGALPGIGLPGGVLVLPTYPRGADLWYVWAAKEMGHRVVGGAAIGAGGVIGPAYGLAVGQESRAIARDVNFTSQRRRLSVVVGPDDSRPNGVTTTGGRPPRPHSHKQNHDHGLRSHECREAVARRRL